MAREAGGREPGTRRASASGGRRRRGRCASAGLKAGMGPNLEAFRGGWLFLKARAPQLELSRRREVSPVPRALRKELVSGSRTTYRSAVARGQSAKGRGEERWKTGSGLRKGVRGSGVSLHLGVTADSVLCNYFSVKG